MVLRIGTCESGQGSYPINNQQLAPEIRLWARLPGHFKTFQIISKLLIEQAPGALKFAWGGRIRAYSTGVSVRRAIQLQVKTILNQVQRFVGFVYQEVRMLGSPEGP